MKARSFPGNQWEALFVVQNFVNASYSAGINPAKVLGSIFYEYSWCYVEKEGADDPDFDNTLRNSDFIWAIPTNKFTGLAGEAFVCARRIVCKRPRKYFWIGKVNRKTLPAYKYAGIMGLQRFYFRP